MFDKAVLGGVSGAAQLTFRYRGQGVREWRGTFAFQFQEEPAVARLATNRIPATFEGMIDGEPKRMEVIVTDVQSSQGLAHFEALGEPF